MGVIMANATIQTRVSGEMKQQAEALFASMGLGLSDAIRMFLQQSINEGGIPFKPRAKELLNEQTRKIRIEKLNQDIQIGLDQAERGEMISADETKKRMKLFKQQFLNGSHE
jgi:DNA-damage-inducible protein J